MNKLGRGGRRLASWRRALIDQLVVVSGTILIVAPSPRLHAQFRNEVLPDAPSVILANMPDGGQSNPQQNSAEQTAPDAAYTKPTGHLNHKQQQAADQAASASLPKCELQGSAQRPLIFLPATRRGCQAQDQIQLIVESGTVRPLTPTEKGILAARAVGDPFNLLTIVGFSGISVAADSHSAYGPGFAGWGRLIGYSLAEDIQGEFTGTFALPVIFHEDPRYHRTPGKPVVRRVEHALIHTIVSQHDDGSLMLNYATLINYPLSAEISNLYVPGLPTNAPSTAKRVALGYATDPVGPLIAEFLPDLAKRVHIHIVFAQQILNRIALGSGNGVGQQQ